MRVGPASNAAAFHVGCRLQDFELPVRLHILSTSSKASFMVLSGLSFGPLHLLRLRKRITGLFISFGSRLNSGALFIDEFWFGDCTRTHEKLAENRLILPLPTMAALPLDGVGLREASWTI